MSTDVTTRPEAVPAELVAAWDLLERGAVRAIVADVDGGVLWAGRPARERHLALARRLRADGTLHESFTPEAFVVVRERAERRAGPGARLADVWSDVPGWCHPGRTRAEVVALELELVVEETVPDPDVALLLAAAAAARVPIAASSVGLLAADQQRRRLEHPTLDAVTWRSVAVDEGPGDDPVARAVPAAEDDRPVLVLSARSREAREGELVVGLGPTAPPSDVAVDRIVDRLRRSPELTGLPGALRPGWLEGATILGPALVGFAEWSVHHAVGRPGPLFCVSEPGSLLPELLAEVVAARRLPLHVVPLPLTPELLAAATADEGPLRTALTLALGGGHPPAAVASLLGLPDEGHDLATLLHGLATDSALRERVGARSAELRTELLAATSGPAEEPVTLCGIGGPGALQRSLAELLRHQGVPRHVVGLHLLSDTPAADAILGDAGGEVLGYLANLGLPADAHARGASWRGRFEAVAGAPARSRTTTGAAAPAADDIELLRTDASRCGVHAFLRQHLRLRAIAGDPVALVDAAERLAARLPTLPPTSPPATPADHLTPPDWVGPAIGVLERDLADTRAEVAVRDAVVASRVYRIALRIRTVVARLRSR
jgi:hypothetical protein